MKYEEIKNSSKVELIKQAADLNGELFQLHIKKKTAQLENKGKIRTVRRDIARIQTKLSELKDGDKHEKK